jgi:hypothetical protein
MPFFVGYSLSTRYMASLAKNLNRFVVKYYCDKLRVLLKSLDTIDKLEQIYYADEKGCRIRFFFL